MAEQEKIQPQGCDCARVVDQYGSRPSCSTIPASGFDGPRDNHRNLTKKSDAIARDEIPDEVRRFILTSIASFPYLEAILLLCGAPKDKWGSKRVAQRLYLSEKVAAELLLSFFEAGALVLSDKLPVLGYTTSAVLLVPDRKLLR